MSPQKMMEFNYNHEEVIDDQRKVFHELQPMQPYCYVLEQLKQQEYPVVQYEKSWETTSGYDNAEYLGQYEGNGMENILHLENPPTIKEESRCVRSYKRVNTPKVAPYTAPPRKVMTPSATPRRVTFSPSATTPMTPSTKACQICGAAATGCHYSVISCEGCKCFFRRTIPKIDMYKCVLGERCVENGNMACQACRLAKCVEMGMKKSNAPKKQ